MAPRIGVIGPMTQHSRICCQFAITMRAVTVLFRPHGFHALCSAFRPPMFGEMLG